MVHLTGTWTPAGTTNVRFATSATFTSFTKTPSGFGGSSRRPCTRSSFQSLGRRSYGRINFVDQAGTSSRSWDSQRTTWSHLSDLFRYEPHVPFVFRTSNLSSVRLSTRYLISSFVEWFTIQAVWSGFNRGDLDRQKLSLARARKRDVDLEGRTQRRHHRVEQQVHVGVEDLVSLIACRFAAYFSEPNGNDVVEVGQQRPRFIIVGTLYHGRYRQRSKHVRVVSMV